MKLLATMFDGLTIARGTSRFPLHRAYGRALQSRPMSNCGRTSAGSPQVVPDETGWRVGGRAAWLHAFVGQRETCYVIDPTRKTLPNAGGAVAGARRWSGTLVHDGRGACTTGSRKPLINNASRTCSDGARNCWRPLAGAPWACRALVLGLIDRESMQLAALLAWPSAER